MKLAKTVWPVLLALSACAGSPELAQVTYNTGLKKATPAPAAATTTTLSGVVLAPRGMTASATQQLISNDGGSIISQDGASLISQDGASLKKRRLTALANQPLAGATVLALDANKKLVARTTTDANGRYELKGLPRGVCMVQVSVKTAEGKPGVLATLADTARAGTADVDAATTMVAVTVVRTRPLAGLDLEAFRKAASAMAPKLVDVPDVAHPQAMIQQAEALGATDPGVKQGLVQVQAPSSPSPSPVSVPTATPIPLASPTPESTLPLLAGTGSAGAQQGPGLQAGFSAPGSLALAPGGRMLIVSDDGNGRACSIDLDDVTAPVATLPLTERLGFPLQLATGGEGSGLLFAADASGHAIRKLTRTGDVSPVEGTRVGEGVEDPRGLAVTDHGNLMVADARTNRLRVVGLGNGNFSTRSVAGNGEPGSADGKGAQAGLNLPVALARATTGPDFYVACAGDGRIAQVIPTGEDDAPRRLATIATGLNQPSALVVVEGLGLVVADAGNNRLALVSLADNAHPVSTLAAGLSRPAGLAWDPSRRRLYVSDTGHHVIRYMNVQP